ncbi:MAG: RNA-binding transcriptional accessory protein [Gammaproteobacteria bacterium]|nr:RNA-binding transcriptional accessory protein [Gammaproteobacteria bacterium]MCF6261661.1 RNA-binding transcriptional accessory protein [Gammaproteobacteria bacterium]
MNIESRIADELDVRLIQVESAIKLLDEGATVPFISRYRKEVTGGLDDTQLRNLEDRLTYLRELEDRRAAVLKSIEEQGKLTEALTVAINGADTKTRLEDLYAPYKQKRRTKAQIAREAGIEPLLDAILADHGIDPQVLAAEYLNEEAGFADAAAVLDGARQIFMERAAEEADLVGRLRDYVWENGLMTSDVVKGEEQNGSKFADYFEFSEAVKKVPSHRALALYRGRSESVLRLKIVVPGQDDLASPLDRGICESMVAAHFELRDEARAADQWLGECARWAWRIKISMQIESELNLRLRESAEEEAIRVFGENMRDLLLAAPAGQRRTMGLDPGLRTGVKVVVVDATGKLLEYTTIFPHAPKNQWDQSLAVLGKLAEKHGVDLVSIGNGTASRETDKLVQELMKKHSSLRLTSLMVSEAGASVYSASELAAREFPELDVTYRGAVSIARRLQDPLAELVKIDPKAIGVGQYQHDVNQTRLAKKLEAVVEDCVNAVGVEINTASAPLLARVAGLSETLATNIVLHREASGAFKNRKQLLKVARLGPKAFEQAAGFLRIREGDNPLDASSVHPEAYPLVEKIIQQSGRKITDIIGDKFFLKGLAANDFVDENFGEPTVRDIFGELEKPGRDPRPEFKTATFKDGVEKLSDLEPGMMLEGVVTNVTNFGAFVDIGVHQDGLVHVSALADKFVKDPREVVKAGQVVKVKVMEVDLPRKRIGLSMRLTDDARDKPQDIQRDRPGAGKARTANRQKSAQSSKQAVNKGNGKQTNSAMADAFAKLKQG